MRKEYDFENMKRMPNPYAAKLKRSVTMRLDIGTLNYFKSLAATTGVPYQTLINLYLRDCAAQGRKPSLKWALPTQPAPASRRARDRARS